MANPDHPSQAPTTARDAYCSVCGNAFRADDRFCGRCGSPRSEPEGGAQSKPAARAASPRVQRIAAIAVLAILVVGTVGVLASYLNVSGASSADPAGLATSEPWDTCALVLHGNNAALFAQGPPGSCASLRQSLASSGVWDTWDSPAPPARDRKLCSGIWNGITITVWDSGGQIYGTAICSAFSLPGL